MSDENISVNATSRSVFGKGASRRLRRDNMVPAILYGADKEPQAIQLKANEVFKHLESEAFYSQLLSVSVDGGEPVRSLLKDVQRHPYKQQILHMDFVRVVAGAELQVSVSLHFTNEDASVGVKSGGIISHTDNEVLIACLPRHIPEYIEVDMSNMNIGDSVHLSSLVLPEGVRLVDLHEAGDDSDRQVAAVNAPRVEAEPSEDDDAAPAASAEDGAAE
ncbi:50S ribosomal protein L25/general stress protein Ctc [Granulosicoccus antarcticus]|uniref:Large ribosomal subunit protein bL25 n=1 Tax=Granulosicoccus antarcticus IMCC3135 TaxID=1192854 RepID=A0A2Z2NYL1_9GAMM|nr:50S ribosomal protein L25/general stress protein Ctc [Granulosicoccus antarcticus]ASJ72234.1 50S ribosomal protein L25 [Granulosicoccus antarcticus IMCC3135]